MFAHRTLSICPSLLLQPEQWLGQQRWRGGLLLLRDRGQHGQPLGGFVQPHAHLSNHGRPSACLPTTAHWSPSFWKHQCEWFPEPCPNAAQPVSPLCTLPHPHRPRLPGTHVHATWTWNWWKLVPLLQCCSTDGKVCEDENALRAVRIISLLHQCGSKCQGKRGAKKQLWQTWTSGQARIKVWILFRSKKLNLLYTYFCWTKK